MIDLNLARQLKEAGLAWHPSERDAFVVPAAGMDDHVFIVSELTALVQSMNGQPSITFHGSAEWALDYVTQADSLWLPSESQLRAALEARLPNHGIDLLQLERTARGYTCSLGPGHPPFHATNADEAYALALLHLLRANAER
ncbi:MAG: hypothetical protein MUD01_14470 [Chloroflexaceae bacterium]|nr:hypothetical protein [Chloroflexaceae bacterium]